MAQRILLQGYYGKGNFGDDVLLTTTYRLFRALYPDAKVSVVVDSAYGAYVQAMLGEVAVLPPGRHGHFDVIVHGGGGVFFDFAQYGVYTRMIECAWLSLGLRAYVATENFIRQVALRVRSSATCRVGIGIGVGTYSTGSPRLRERLPILADFAALWVRDAQSTSNLERFKPILRAEVIKGSDLAFLTEHWLAENISRKPAAIGQRKKLGIALRDWPVEWGGISEAALQEAIGALAQRYDITGLILDAHTDPLMRRVLAAYPTVVWQPERMTIQDFASALAAQDVLLTSRAHAAICGACVGTPSVIVAIEPKLCQVATMLPQSAVLVEPTDPGCWTEAIARAMGIASVAIAADVLKNRSRSLAAWQRVRRVLP